MQGEDFIVDGFDVGGEGLQAGGVALGRSAQRTQGFARAGQALDGSGDFAEQFDLIGDRGEFLLGFKAVEDALERGLGAVADGGQFGQGRGAGVFHWFGLRVPGFGFQGDFLTGGNGVNGASDKMDLNGQARTNRD